MLKASHGKQGKEILMCRDRIILWADYASEQVAIAEPSSFRPISTVL